MRGKHWPGTVAHVGLSSGTSRVTMSVQIAPEHAGTKRGRVVYLNLTPADARYWAAALTRYADAATTEQGRD